MAKPVLHNIIFSCEVNTYKEQDPFVYEHVLALIISGSLDFISGTETFQYSSGTLGLLKRNQLARVIKRPDGEKPFTAIYIHLDQETLKKYSEAYHIKAEKIYTGPPTVILELKPVLNSYFDSLKVYIERPEELTQAMTEIKTWELIELLLRHPGLKDLLFDFSEPHKIDLESYMRRHFYYNVPLIQFAKLTGRSISTFKRDFSKIFNSTPERWLQKQRLEMAYFLISKKNKKPSEVYLEVGFENFSHFSTAFKKEFGINASVLIK